MRLAHTLVELRLERKLTQWALGKAAGVSHSTISHIEGGGDPKVSTIYAIADALEVAPSVLLPALTDEQEGREAERTAKVIADHLAALLRNQ